MRLAGQMEERLKQRLGVGESQTEVEAGYGRLFLLLIHGDVSDSRHHITKNI